MLLYENVLQNKLSHRHPLKTLMSIENNSPEDRDPRPPFPSQPSRLPAVIQPPHEALVSRDPRRPSSITSRIQCLLMNYLLQSLEPKPRFRGRQIFNVYHMEQSIIHSGHIPLHDDLVQQVDICGLDIEGLHLFKVHIMAETLTLRRGSNYSVWANIIALSANNTRLDTPEGDYSTYISSDVVAGSDTNTDSWDYMNFKELLIELRKAVYLKQDEFGERRSDFEIRLMVPQVRGPGEFHGRDFLAA